MATMNFPSSPTLNQTYSFGGATWQWNGTGWKQLQTSALPSQTGNSGKYLTTDGTNASWATVAGGGGAPGGTTTQIQFNNAGAFDGASGLVYNSTTGTAEFPQLTLTTNPSGTNSALFSSARTVIPTVTTRRANSPEISLRPFISNDWTGGDFFYNNSTAMYGTSLFNALGTAVASLPGIDDPGWASRNCMRITAASANAVAGVGRLTTATALSFRMKGDYTKRSFYHSSSFGYYGASSTTTRIFSGWLSTNPTSIAATTILNAASADGSRMGFLYDATYSNNLLFIYERNGFQKNIVDLGANFVMYNTISSASLVPSTPAFDVEFFWDKSGTVYYRAYSWLAGVATSGSIADSGTGFNAATAAFNVYPQVIGTDTTVATPTYRLLASTGSSWNYQGPY